MMRISRPLCVLGGLLLGVAIGYGASVWSVRLKADSLLNALVPIQEQGGSYTFIHPLLAYRTPEATEFGAYVTAKSRVQQIANAAIENGNASRVSVYFRDLDRGEWFGINPEDPYYPASLLKVPIMIAYYKEAEEISAVFSNQIPYSPSVIPDSPFEATSTLSEGQSYSVQELIRRMAVESDNGAAFTLLDRINPDFLRSVYVALGIPDPGDNSTEYQISAHTYALFFRILYNATYLSQKHSEDALALLAQSTFTNGLVAGVPKDTAVAHKFGQHVIAKDYKAVGVELSDCGIVYFPKHPYALCVMTKAPDTTMAEDTIMKISRATYASVVQEYAN